MNDERNDPLPSKPFRHQLEPDVRDVVNGRVRGRGLRRAIAINAVQMARDQRGDATEPWTTEESDILMAIMELLEKVAGT
jgi:hypothetical protein